MKSFANFKKTKKCEFNAKVSIETKNAKCLKFGKCLVVFLERAVSVVILTEHCNVADKPKRSFQVSLV